MRKVLFCGLKYEYGVPALGLSFEYQNFYKVLQSMEAVAVELFAIDEVLKQYGRDAMNEKLISVVQETQPDLLFCFLFTDELKKETIAYITNKTKTKTFNWFADDHWRFPIYSKYWAPLFTAVSTTDSQAVSKYKLLGVKPIKTQWAANPFLYQPKEPLENTGTYRVTFVGKQYGNRKKILEWLQAQGIAAVGYGSGWSTGRVSFEEMLQIFSYSKININFTESSPMDFQALPKLIGKLFIKKHLGKYHLDAHHIGSNIQSLFASRRKQIKGRIFEVAACGGFLLSGDADNLAEYYVPNKEIVIFKNKQDLLMKCKYFLEHEDIRLSIAAAGLKRTLQDHTYIHRFNHIFKELELG